MTFLISPEKQERLREIALRKGLFLKEVLDRGIDLVLEEYLRESFGSLVFQTKIRENVDIAESPLQGTDIFSYSPKSPGAKDYRDLALEVDSKWK